MSDTMASISRSTHRPNGWRTQVFWTFIIVLALGGPMIWFHRASNRNLISFHGTLHMAMAQRFDESAFPPENPYFAGTPVRYYWFYHYIGHLLSEITGQNVLYSFEQISLIGLVALAVAAVAIGSMLFGSAGCGAIIGLLALAGSNPLGWAIALAKYLRDGPIVLGDVSRGATGPMLYLVQYGDHRLSPNFVYWIHTTGRAVSLGFALVVLALVLRALRKPGILALSAVALSLACCTAMSPLIGLACGGALLVGLVLTSLSQRLLPVQTSEPIPGGVVVGVVSSIVIGVVLALPTFWNMIGGGVSPEIHLDPFRGKYLASIGVNSLVLLVCGLFGIAQVGPRVRPSLLIGLFGGLALLLLTGLFKLPAGNEHNFFNLAGVFLAVPAAAFCVRVFRGELRLSTKRVVLTVMLFLPTSLLVMTAYAARPVYAISLERDRVALTDEANPYGRAYTWLYENTKPNAVIVMSPYERRPLLCNVSDLPAMTGRVLFVDHATYMTQNYPDFVRRCVISQKLVGGERLRSTDVEYLSQLGRPIYVLVEGNEETSLNSRFLARYGQPVFDAGVVRIFRWKPTKYTDVSLRGLLGGG